MANPIFTVETGSVVANANALVSVADADQIIANYGDSSDWSGASQADKENAIREATRYLNLHYIWYGYKVDEDQTCQWPRYSMYDEDGNSVSWEIVPERVKEACAHLALQVIDGDTLLEDFQNESKVKRTKDVIGPITEEREYADPGESPEKTYQIADRFVAPFVLTGSYFGTDLERA